jgi:VanZ family protein
MALIFFLSAQPEVPRPFALSAKLLAIAGHLVMFGVLALLVFRSLAAYVDGLLPRAAFALGFTVLYGVSDEIHQSFVPGRTPTVLDVLVDALGAAAVLAAAIYAERRWGQARDK